MLRKLLLIQALLMPFAYAQADVVSGNEDETTTRETTEAVVAEEAVENTEVTEGVETTEVEVSEEQTTETAEATEEQTEQAAVEVISGDAVVVEVENPLADAQIEATSSPVAASAESEIPQMPLRGDKMSFVEEAFGTPSAKSEPVGTPAIIRWSYEGFTVYFEGETVIHSVMNR